MKTVSELMTCDVVTARESDTLESADRWLEAGHIRHLPVVRRKKLVGVITHRDLLRHCRRSDPKTGLPYLVRDAMTADVLRATPDMPLREAVRLMLSNRIGCLPVTLADGTLAGIVTESDLLRFAADKLDELDRREEGAAYA